MLIFSQRIRLWNNFWDYRVFCQIFDQPTDIVDVMKDFGLFEIIWYYSLIYYG